MSALLYFTVLFTALLLLTFFKQRIGDHRVYGLSKLALMFARHVCVFYCTSTGLLAFVKQRIGDHVIRNLSNLALMLARRAVSLPYHKREENPTRTNHCRRRILLGAPPPALALLS